MGGVSGRRGVWVLLDKVADENASAFEPPVTDVEALHAQRRLEYGYNERGMVFFVG